MANPAELRRLYEVEQWTLADIAADEGISTKAARPMLEDAGTTMRNPGPALPPEFDNQS
jgi:hypothetical protein